MKARLLVPLAGGRRDRARGDRRAAAADAGPDPDDRSASGSQPPSAAHLLGQDEYGRDVLSRLIWGARASLFVAGVSAILALDRRNGPRHPRRIPARHRRASARCARSTSCLCFPPILLALLIVTILGPGIGTLILVLSVLFLPGFVRVSYAGVLSVRSHQLCRGDARARCFALADHAAHDPAEHRRAGAGPVQPRGRGRDRLESGLSFLGLGVVPPAPSWGAMIRGARAIMDRAPLLLLFPVHRADADDLRDERAVRRAARYLRSA